MQTKQQIQRLLASAGLSPNKRRGQNFMIDLNLMRLLLSLADIQNNDVVLEVGCGTGSLTQELVQRAGHVVIAEIEPLLAEITAKQISKNTNFEIITADILKSKNTIDSCIIEALQRAKKVHSGRLLLVANLPYSIAAPVMINLIVGSLTVDAMYVTVQKEVAQRMTADAGSKHYGSLSIFLAVAGEIKTERILKPTVFWPAPQVDSAIIAFVANRAKIDRIENMELFGNVVSLFMNHRRKMLKACTKFADGKLSKIHDWSSVFQHCAIDPHKRPEEILPDEYISIANICSEYLAS